MLIKDNNGFKFSINKPIKFICVIIIALIVGITLSYLSIYLSGMNETTTHKSLIEFVIGTLSMFSLVSGISIIAIVLIILLNTIIKSYSKYLKD